MKNRAFQGVILLKTDIKALLKFREFFESP